MTPSKCPQWPRGGNPQTSSAKGFYFIEKKKWDGHVYYKLESLDQRETWKGTRRVGDYDKGRDLTNMTQLIIRGFKCRRTFGFLHWNKLYPRNLYIDQLYFSMTYSHPGFKLITRGLFFHVSVCLSSVGKLLSPPLTLLHRCSGPHYPKQSSVLFDLSSFGSKKGSRRLPCTRTTTGLKSEDPGSWLSII